jgi:TfoX/Sxy family transcriptional regulator of competence genes
MASNTETVAYICDQMRGAGQISTRAMFGEYAVYCDGRIVALICNNQLFLKPTPGALAVLPEATLAPPYPSAKPHFLCDDVLEEPSRLARAVTAVLQDLPPPKPKKPRKSKAKP